MDSPEGKDDSSNAGAAHSKSAAQRSVVVDGHRIESRELLGDGREVVIVHGAEIYRLRLTAQNKLILTK